MWTVKYTWFCFYDTGSAGYHTASA